jgi:hypothetical protein
LHRPHRTSLACPLGALALALAGGAPAALAAPVNDDVQAAVPVTADGSAVSGMQFRRKLQRSARIGLSIIHAGQIGAVRDITVGRHSVADRSLCWWPTEHAPRKCY